MKYFCMGNSMYMIDICNYLYEILPLKTSIYFQSCPFDMPSPSLSNGSCTAYTLSALDQLQTFKKIIIIIINLTAVEMFKGSFQKWNADCFCFIDLLKQKWILKNDHTLQIPSFDWRKLFCRSSLVGSTDNQDHAWIREATWSVMEADFCIFKPTLTYHDSWISQKKKLKSRRWAAGIMSPLVMPNLYNWLIRYKVPEFSPKNTCVKLE